MKIIRKINNNAAVGLDSNNREVVLFGKGIGFPAVPYELHELSKVDRTFYDIDERYCRLIEEIDIDLLNTVDYMVNVVKAKIKGNWDKNLTFMLADHINFSLQRIQQGMRVEFPYSYEIETDFQNLINVPGGSFKILIKNGMFTWKKEKLPALPCI